MTDEQKPANATPLCWVRPATTIPELNGFQVCREGEGFPVYEHPPATPVGAEPVAWRYKLTKHDPEWTVVSKKPTGKMLEVEPLYAAPIAAQAQHLISEVCQESGLPAPLDRAEVLHVLREADRLLPNFTSAEAIGAWREKVRKIGAGEIIDVPAQQPVSGADGLPTERVLIDGTAYELPAAVAAELLRLHLEILGSEQAQSSGNPEQLDHLPDATKMVPGDQSRDTAQMIEPSGNSRELGEHNLSTSAGGRAYVAEYFSKRLGRHDFTRYISGRLAVDFACALAQHLSQQDANKVDAERYRSIRKAMSENDQRFISAMREYGEANFSDFGKPTLEELDAALDAARKESGDA